MVGHMKAKEEEEEEEEEESSDDESEDLQTLEGMHPVCALKLLVYAPLSYSCMRP
jgi:hypothetical protein